MIQRILASNLFYSHFSIARKVRSPIELGIGVLRCLHGSADLDRVAQGLEEIGQAVFYPPNVKGWDGGRAWINTSTLLGRSNLVGELLRNEKTRFDGQDLDTLTRQCGVESPEELVDWLNDLLCAVPLSEPVGEQLADVVRQSKGDRSRRIADLMHTLSSLPQFQLA